MSCRGLRKNPRHVIPLPTLMDRQEFLITRLSDGHFHSGESLAKELKISRAAICKRIKSLARLGLDIYSVRGKGYRLSRPLELLDAEEIRTYLPGDSRNKLSELLVLSVVDSTNRFLFRSLENESIHARAILAEYQESGKGRRGNDWVSPYAAGICLSVGWQFDSPPASLNALSLATGVIVCRCLRQMGAKDTSLKWPNDIVSDGRKLGGILLESRSESGGRSDVIIGIGLNVSISDDMINNIDQPVTSINQLCSATISRNQLTAKLIQHLLLLLEQYPHNGFAGLIEEWRTYDAYKDRRADLVLPGETLSGKILGITESGMLQMDIDGVTRVFSGGELSLRVRQ